MSKNLGNIPRQVEMTEEQEQTFTNGINKGRKLERSMLLEYTYPDGLGTGGTFTDGDQFSQETVQTIIDNVVAVTKAGTEQRIIKLLEAGSRDSNLLDDIYDGVMYGFIKRAEFKERLIALIKGENK